jgi:hypothetical protein
MTTREKLREEIYEFPGREKIINEKYMKEEASDTVLLLDLAPAPIHPNFFNYVLILPDDVVRAGSLLK